MVGKRLGAELRCLNHPSHITMAFGASTHEQQISTPDGAAEVDDRGLVSALAAPDIG